MYKQRAVAGREHRVAVTLQDNLMSPKNKSYVAQNGKWAKAEKCWPNLTLLQISHKETREHCQTSHVRVKNIDYAHGKHDACSFGNSLFVTAISMTQKDEYYKQ